MKKTTATKTSTKTAAAAKTSKTKAKTAKKSRDEILLRRNSRRAEKVEALIDGLREWVGTNDTELSDLCENAAAMLDRYHTILGKRAEKHAARLEA